MKELKRKMEESVLNYWRDKDKIESCYTTALIYAKAALIIGFLSGALITLAIYSIVK